jgi:acyl carrier protein
MLDLEKLVIDNLRSFNRQLPVPRRIAETPDAVVIGPEAAFDSLDSVEFLMGLEDEIAALIDRRIDLCRHIEGMAREIVTVGELTACIEQLVARTRIAVVQA